MRPLVLFDIDGTMLAGASRLHTAAFTTALAHRYGAPDPFVVEGGRVTCGGRSLAGRIDSEIARWCLELAGLPAGGHDEELDPYCELINRSYLAATADGLGAEILPGVEAVLAACAAAGAPCGVVTGNLEPIAARKLSRTGLAAHFNRGGGLVGGCCSPFSAPSSTLQTPRARGARRRQGVCPTGPLAGRTLARVKPPGTGGFTRQDGQRLAYWQAPEPVSRGVPSSLRNCQV